MPIPEPRGIDPSAKSQWNRDGSCHGWFSSVLLFQDNHSMRLFLFAVAISSIATLLSGVSIGQDPQGSGSAPLPNPRFAESPARNYLIARARQDSENRNALLRYYEATGFNYGQPEIAGNFFFSAAPPKRFRRVFAYPILGVPDTGFAF